MNIDSIQNGVVLDHIQAGKSMDIYRYLHLDQLDCSVAIIKNVRSGRMGKKDIIKIDSPMEVDLDVLGYIDPNITVNIIRNGVRVEKKHLELLKKLVKRLPMDASPYFLVAPRHCRIHHIGQHTPDHYGEQRRRMRACRERSRYSHCLVRKPLHASSDDKEEKRHSTVSPPQRSSVFAPYPETAFIRQELPPRGLPTRRKPREEEEWRSGGREGKPWGCSPFSKKDSPLPPIPLLHPSTPSTSPGFRASDRSGRR